VFTEAVSFAPLFVAAPTKLSKGSSVFLFHTQLETLQWIISVQRAGKYCTVTSNRSHVNVQSNFIIEFFSLDETLGKADAIKSNVALASI